MAEKYQKMTQREHILKRPDTYIGDIEPTTEKMWVYSEDDQLIMKKEITYVPGLYKIFDEILVNARDHSVNDKTCNQIKVEINLEEGYFKVFNNGDNGIPVEEHPTHKILVPSMIFGELLTSSNYDDTQKRTTGGRNGLGGKLSSVFSKKFMVEVQDQKNGKHFYQEWENNMEIVNKPKVTKKSTKSYVEITSYPDLERFKIKDLRGHYELFKKRVYDVACTTDKVKVYFNEELIEVKNLNQYMDYYYPGLDKILDISNDRFKFGCIYFPDNGGENISFVNGISTYRGGTHINHLVDNVIKTLINDYLKKKEKDIKISPNVLKDNLIFFLDSVIDNPSFSSQTKDTLTTKYDKFGFKYEVSDLFIKKLAKSGLIEQIINFAKFKENETLKKTDGKKTSTLRGIPKLEDANKAGTKDSTKCSLILTEGDSAKAMVMAGLSVIGRDYYGIFPLKGKVLNVREANIKQITENEEISNLKKIIGLRNDYSYETEDQFNSLRYGRIIALTDQDHDGSHIKGLIMNLFHFLWPALLKRKGFLTSLNTPIVKVTKKDKVISFYTLTDYEEWKEKNNNGKGYEIKYYKGLGTSDNKEAKEYFKDLKSNLIEYQWLDEIMEMTEDSENENSETKKPKIKKKNNLKKEKTVHTVSDEAIELAFSKELADKRKDWLMTYNPKEILDSKNKQIPIPEFIHKDLKHFSNDDTQRSIPSVIDGFKPSQRKVLHGAFLRGLEKDQIKVAQLAGFVSDRVAYHHGEASLMGAIIGMAQDYMGSNNLNVLEPKGQFGSRVRNGKDSASPRYIFTKIEKLAQLVFRKEDNPILNYLNDDGLMVEPDFFLPIIPMILVNGAVGIGTGFSTNIPCHHPVQIIDNLLELLNGNKMKKLQPWYRKFKGNIKKIDTTSYLVKGLYNVDKKKNHVEITELPVGEATDNYKEFLEKMLDNDKDFNSYENHSNDEEVRIILKFKELPEEIEDKLKLTKKINLTNLHGYTSEGHIQRFETIEEIVQEYFKTRLDGYVRRKAYLLKVYLHQLQLISYRVKFIKEIINKTLLINNKPRKTIEEELEKKKYPMMSITNHQASEDEKSYDYLLGMNLYSLTMEKVKELETQEKEKQTTYDNLHEMTPEEIWKEELEELKTELLKNKLYY